MLGHYFESKTAICHRKVTSRRAASTAPPISANRGDIRFSDQPPKFAPATEARKSTRRKAAISSSNTYYQFWVEMAKGGIKPQPA
ncbi:MAG TPA: hypothetical protein VF627_15015, partial [Abditibacterium sp.]